MERLDQNEQGSTMAPLESWAWCAQLEWCWALTHSGSTKQPLWEPCFKRRLSPELPTSGTILRRGSWFRKCSGQDLQNQHCFQACSVAQQGTEGCCFWCLFSGFKACILTGVIWGGGIHLHGPAILGCFQHSPLWVLRMSHQPEKAVLLLVSSQLPSTESGHRSVLQGSLPAQARDAAGASCKPQRCSPSPHRIHS